MDLEISSLKSGHAIKSEEEIAGEPARPKLFQISGAEAFRLVLGSLAFALVFLYPVFCGDYAVVSTQAHQFSLVQHAGSGLAGWLRSWPNFEHLKIVPSFGDRDLFAELRWVPYYTVRHFHQFPFWDPYRCGGMPLLGNPEAAVFSPYLSLYALVGLIPGMLLEIYLHLAIGFVGGYLLGREYRLTPLASSVLAVMFMSSSWLSLHVAAGHLNFLSFAYVPWIIAMLLATCRMRQWYPAAIGGLFWAFTLTEGNYAFAYTGVLMAILVAAMAVTRFTLRPLVAAAALGLFATGFSSMKLLPASQMLSLYPRDFGSSWVTWGNAFISVFSRNQDLLRPATGPFGFSEFGGYVGWPFALLAALALIGAGRNMLPWALSTIFFFLVYKGDDLQYAPSHLFRHIPFGINMSICGRWVIPVVFCVGVLAALGAESLSGRFGRWGPRLVALLLVVGSIDAWIVCAGNYRYLFETDTNPPSPSPSFRQDYMQQPTLMYPMAAANMGSANCFGYGYSRYTTAALQRGPVLGYNEARYRGEYYLLGGGTVRQIFWSPNRLKYEVDVPATTALVINQNIYPGWRVRHGAGEVYDEGGLIAVRIPPGQQKIELTYRPTNILWSYLSTLIATLGLILLWVAERSRHYRKS